MGIPLVGQPLDILGWTLIVQVQCKCDRPKVLALVVKQSELGRAADQGICPNCARPMHIAQIAMNAQNQLEFGIDLGTPDRVPVGTPS